MGKNDNEIVLVWNLVLEMLELFRDEVLLLTFNQVGIAGVQSYVMICVNFQLGLSWFQPGGGLARLWRLF